MATEGQNRIASELEGLDYVPGGFAFNHDGTWNKIRARKNSKSIKRAILFAASLIPIVVVAVSFMNGAWRHDQKPLVNTKPIKHVAIIPGQSSLVEKKLPTKVANVIPSRNKKEVIDFAEDTLEQVKLIQPVIEEPVQEVVAVFQDTSSLAVVPKPKYKYRIVHINEIDEIKTPSSTVATNKTLKKPFLATINETSNEQKLVVEKKKIMSFLTVPTQ